MSIAVIYVDGTRCLEAPLSAGGDFMTLESGKVVFYSKLRALTRLVRETHGPGSYFCEEVWYLKEVLTANVPYDLSALPHQSKREVR